MPLSLKSQLSKFVHKGQMSKEEYNTLIKKLDGHDREIRNKAISEFADRLIINFSDWQMSLAEVGNEKEFAMIDKAMIGIEKIAEQLKGE